MTHTAILGDVEVPITYYPDEAVGLMQHAGIVGCGGAGFPTYAKFDHPPHTLIVNAAESEPGYYADKLLMRDEPEALVQVFDFLQKTFSMETMIIAAEDVARPYMAELEDLAKRLKAFSVAYIEPKYAYGQEKALCKAVLGMDIPRDRYPIQHGVIVSNVESLFNVYRAVYRDEPVCTKFMHVYGEVGPPRVFEAPVGALAADLLRIYGVDPADYKDCRLYDGGPILCDIKADPMGPEPLIPVHRTTNAFLVVHPDKDRPRKRYYPGPGWDTIHNAEEAPWAPSLIENIEARIRRVHVPLTNRFWHHGTIVVAPGDPVVRGDTLAEPASEPFSVGIHASIPGTVVDVTQDHVMIER